MLNGNSVETGAAFYFVFQPSVFSFLYKILHFNLMLSYKMGSLWLLLKSEDLKLRYDLQSLLNDGAKEWTKSSIYNIQDRNPQTTFAT